MRVHLYKYFPLLVLLGLVLTATLVHPKVAQHRPSDVDAILEARVLPPSLSRFLSFGFGSVLADVAYLQAIQVVATPNRHNFSDRELARKGLAAWRLLDYATDMDPQFAYAYVFGANVIPVERLDGSALNVNEAVLLLEKGTQELKDDWRLPFNLAYLRSAHLADYAGAAEAMAMAVEAGGGPTYLPSLATRLSAQGGAIETGLALAGAMRDNAVDEEQRAIYEARFRLLEMERDLRLIEAAAQAYEERTGSRPGSLSDLLSSQDLRVIPQEPHGGTYTYDPIQGVARSSHAERLRIFDRSGREAEEDEETVGVAEADVENPAEGAGERAPESPAISGSSSAAE